MESFTLSSRIVNFQLLSVLVLSVVAALPEFSSSNPIADEGTVAENEGLVNNSENVTEPMRYEKEDIVTAMAAEFLSLIAGDHIFLPEPLNLDEDIELHRNAQILANLLTRLNCTRRVYALLNNTAQEMYAAYSGSEISERHPFTDIFDRVIEGLKSDSWEVYAEFLREESKLKDEPYESVLVHRNKVSSSKRMKTFYDITSTELSAIEELLNSQLVKKVVLTIELLRLAEESLDEAPKSATLYRKRLETAKAVFKLADSESMETRLRIQKVFDEALNEALEHFDVVFGNRNQDNLCDSLSKKIEDDQVLKGEFYCVKDLLT